MDDRGDDLLRIDELWLSTLLESTALILLLDKKGLLCKEEVLAEIKSLQQQLAQRTDELPDQQEPFPQPYPNVQVENDHEAMFNRITDELSPIGHSAFSPRYERGS